MTRTTYAAVGVALLAALAAVGVSVGPGVVGAQSSASGDGSIAVSATGSADASPDRAVVRVAATASGDAPGGVRDDLAADSEQLQAALDDLGVAYETAGYDIDGERGRAPPERREGAGDGGPAYRGVHAYEVTVNDTDRVGAVIDAAADTGAEVEGVRLTLSEERRETVQQEAIRDAMGEARSQAVTIAESGDLRITGVAAVDAARDRYRPVRVEAAAGGDGAGGTAIAAGDVSVRYSVQVTYNATSR